MPVPVAFMIDTLERGGAERVVVSLANELDPACYQAYVITTRAPGLLAADLGAHVRLHSLARRTRWDVHAIYRFARLLDAQGIRVLHIHSHTSAYYALLARRLSRAKPRYVMHDHHGHIGRAPMLRALDRMFLPGVDYYFGVAEHLVQYAVTGVGLPASRCEFLSNGIAVPSQLTRTPSDRFTVVQVASVQPRKNQLLAIEVAARVRAAVPHLRWLVVGRIDAANGPYMQQCAEALRRNQLEETVQFVGEHSDIPALLAQAHVGVLTSRDEGLPIALLEYMAAGLPSVVTDVGECRSVVIGSGGGAVLPVGDVAAFADALIALAREPERAAEWGRNNYRHALASYSSRAMVGRVMQVYDNLLAA